MSTPETTPDTALEAHGVRARLGRVYAEALLALAEQSHSADSVGAELDSVAFEIIGKNPTVAAYLENPAIGSKAKLPILGAAFEGTASDLFKKFLAVLAQNNRLGLLRDIATAYRGIRDRRAGRVRVLVRTATPLSDHQKIELVETLAKPLNQQPILNVRVEPELLGGLIVQIGDRVYDTSVRTRLESLRNTLLAS